MLSRGSTRVGVAGGQVVASDYWSGNTTADFLSATGLDVSTIEEEKPGGR